jgi:hypothetical protein
MDVSPGRAGSEESREEGACRAMAAGGRLEISGRADGAVEVTEEQSRDLHVERVGDLQHGEVEAGALNWLGGQRGIDGQKEKAVRETGTWGDPDSMKAA